MSPPGRTGVTRVRDRPRQGSYSPRPHLYHLGQLIQGTSSSWLILSITLSTSLDSTFVPNNSGRVEKVHRPEFWYTGLWESSGTTRRLKLRTTTDIEGFEITENILSGEGLSITLTFKRISLTYTFKFETLFLPWTKQPLRVSRVQTPPQTVSLDSATSKNTSGEFRSKRQEKKKFPHPSCESRIVQYHFVFHEQGDGGTSTIITQNDKLCETDANSSQVSNIRPIYECFKPHVY